MEVELIFKVAAVGILVAVLNILLTRSGREEQALMVTITGLVIVLVLVATGVLTNFWLRPLVNVGYAVLSAILSPFASLF